ncbi:CPBP family intramembrane glutamic endopeptidase [Brachybacterium sp. GCM10030267]|uniref:CPBP family intramembrane glutamic endopeptidase n=1 Tax=unclassified Brachybacterium TaxID=2623841 RepID=UPI00361AAC08
MRASTRPGALGLCISLEVLRFLVILAALAIAPLFGITGWYMGLFANVLCVVYAIVIVSVLGLWRDQGVLRLWRSPWAALWLLPFVVEALIWLVHPGGFSMQPPGILLWSLTRLFVGVNEELVNRVAVLGTLRRAFSPVPSAVLSGALFGLAHLSLLVTTPGRATDDVLLNVLASATYGFALAASQLRFRWLLPLVFIHATADMTVIMTGGQVPLWTDIAIHGGFVVLGVLLLRSPGHGVDPAPDAAAANAGQR